MSDFSAPRLPRGRHRLSREQVAESQRWRLLRAAGEVLAAHGYTGVTSRRIAGQAHVSSAAFYKYFDDADDCLLAAHAMAVDCVWELTSAACAGAGSWPERLGTALQVVADFLVAEPALARLLCADIAAGIPAVAAERERFLECLAGLLWSGREQLPSAAHRLPTQTEIHLTGAAVTLLGGRIVAGELDAIPTLAPEAAAILCSPYEAVGRSG